MIEPNFITAIDQHVGTHSSGARYTKIKEIVTRFSDHSQEAWDALTPEQKDWWTESLCELHAAEVDLASLSPEQRETVRERLDFDDDIGHAAATIRRAIDKKDEVAA